MTTTYVLTLGVSIHTKVNPSDICYYPVGFYHSTFFPVLIGKKFEQISIEPEFLKPLPAGVEILEIAHPYLIFKIFVTEITTPLPT